MLLAVVAMVVMAAAAPINDAAVHWTPINETAIQWTTLSDGEFPLTLTMATTLSTTWTLPSPFPTGAYTYSGSAILTVYATLASPLPSAPSTGLPTTDMAASPSVFPTAGPQTAAPSPFPVERRVDDDDNPLPTPSPLVPINFWPALKDDTPLGFPLSAAAAVFPEPSHNEKRHSHPPVIVDLSDIADADDDAAVLAPRGRLAADDPRIGSVGYKHYMLSLKAASKAWALKERREALEGEKPAGDSVSAENACVGGAGPDCTTVAVSRRPRPRPDTGDHRWGVSRDS
ncbi:MAG: hypothetical protein Q9171_006488 [Xanthocarpia ochracea]